MKQKSVKFKHVFLSTDFHVGIRKVKHILQAIVHRTTTIAFTSFNILHEILAIVQPEK